ncbi:helix-turn-helix domain-containing protein [Dactylosporangium sp. NPDC000244]|uniref:helix-turn-helix domain-containing protein n=1 Tax=Dactylosporangium sp. NPDC000244 TaxID=3154365 RepID=UPI00331A1E23
MSAPTAEQTTTAADTVARVLADHPDGITVKDLATAAGIGASTASKALTAMEADGTATRTTGPANGNRKPADLWHPATSDTTSNTPADDTTTEEASMPTTDTTTTDDATTDDATTDDATTDDATTDDATATDNGTTDDATEDTTATDTTATGDDATGDAASGVPVGADQPTADTPAPAAPRKKDLRVLLMAGVLGDHPDGVSAAEAIAESGLAIGVGDTILIAMEAVGVAERQADDDGHETWFLLADGDLDAVDPANAPTHVTCHACGHASPIRRAYNPGPVRRTPALRSAPTGRTTVEINSDGSARLGKNELRTMVEAFMRTLGPGHRVTPGHVGRELGRSPGAVNNAMEKMPEVVTRVNDAPVMFETLPNLPAPSAAVAAHMTPPVVATPAATTDTATDAPADETPAAAAPTVPATA